MKANKILDSAKEVLEKRWGSAMYGTFFISWVIWNWEVIYLTIFVDQDLIYEITNNLKIHYVVSQYSWDGFWSVVWSLVRLMFGPAFSTFVILWGIAEIDILCYKKDVSNDIRKENEKIKQQGVYLKKEKKVLKEKEQNISLAKDIEREMPKKQKWNNEYSAEILNSKFSGRMNEFKICLYDNRGNLIQSNLSSDNLAYLDSNGLIGFEGKFRQTIIATDKGKYFLKKFLQDKVS